MTSVSYKSSFAKGGCLSNTTAAALDVKIRSAGWHFMWPEDAYSRCGVGRTAKAAIGKTVTLALHDVKGQFNSAELGSANVLKYRGFHVAKVTLCARQI